MTFVVKKKISLAYLGEGWEEAFVVFTPFAYSDNIKLLEFRKFASSLDKDSKTEEITKMSNQMLDLILEKFIEGMGFDGEKLTPITKENFTELPNEVIERIVGQLKGDDLSPKG
jgi:hypothetical protein